MPCTSTPSFQTRSHISSVTQLYFLTLISSLQTPGHGAWTYHSRELGILKLRSRWISVQLGARIIVLQGKGLPRLLLRKLLNGFQGSTESWCRQSSIQTDLTHGIRTTIIHEVHFQF